MKVQANKVPVLRAFEHLKKSFISLEPHGFNRGSCQPIYLLFAYPKNVKDDLTEHEKKIMRQLVDRLKFALRNKETNQNDK